MGWNMGGHQLQDGPRVLGVNRTQDASVCLFEGGPPVRITAIQKERLTRGKHHWGRLGDLGLYARRIPEILSPLDLVVECYSSDPEIGRHTEYTRELKSTLRFREEPRRIVLSHHVAHLYSSFPLSPFQEAAAMVIDFAGS